MGDWAIRKPLPANARWISIPAAALGPWLAEIENPDELKVTFRALALIAEGVSRRGAPPSVTVDDLLDDTFLEQGCGGESIRRGLAAALERGTLLATHDRGEVRIFLNDDAGQQRLENAGLKPLSPADALGASSESPLIHWLPQEQPGASRVSIFTLYEEHIGSYGHSVAEQLKAAESEFPLRWIEDAFAEAAERNALSWSYIHAILRRWLQEGRYAGAGVATGLQREQHHEHGKPGHDTAPDSRKTNLDDYRERYGRLPWETDNGDSG